MYAGYRLATCHVLMRPQQLPDNIDRGEFGFFYISVPLLGQAFRKDRKYNRIHCNISALFTILLPLCGL
jgi:hypothetical protein